MTRFLPATAVVLSGLALASAAHAVDVLNEDGRDYDVIVVENGVESVFTLFSGGSEEDVCARCTISVDGIGDIEASGKEMVIISGGKLTKRSG